MHFPATLRWALVLSQAALALGAASNATSIQDLSLGALDEKLQVRTLPTGLPGPLR